MFYWIEIVTLKRCPSTDLEKLQLKFLESRRWKYDENDVFFFRWLSGKEFGLKKNSVFVIFRSFQSFLCTYSEWFYSLDSCLLICRNHVWITACRQGRDVFASKIDFFGWRRWGAGGNELGYFLWLCLLLRSCFLLSGGGESSSLTEMNLVF